MDSRDVVDAAVAGRGLQHEDAISLLDLPAGSPECAYLVSSVDRLIRSICGNAVSIGAQIGVVTGPCYADCRFCSFAVGNTDMEPYVMSSSELERYIRAITSDKGVSSISIMTIHDFEFDDLIRLVHTASSVLPDGVELAVNTGDLTGSECNELKDAGVVSAYHALRLGEGIENRLEPFQRVRTMKNLLSAGIDVYTGVEPVGPEHSSSEILDLYMSAAGRCTACSVSARESFEGSRMADLGVITEQRLRQIRSVMYLAGLNGGPQYGGFYGGFDHIFAEYGGSPKDPFETTERNLGRTVGWARRKASDCGFKYIRNADGSVSYLC